MIYLMNLLLFTFVITTSAFAESGSVPSSALELMAREESSNQAARFEAKLGCSEEETPRCLPDALGGYTRWANSVNNLHGGSGICTLRPDEKVNGSGVTDQWACLTKYQEIREELWKKKHEEFFTDPFVPRDYFELKKKFPRALLVNYTSLAKEVAFVDYKCGKFNLECWQHFSHVIESLLYGLPDVVCAHPGTVNRTRFPAKTLQADAEASEQCLDFAYLTFKKSYRRLVSENLTPDTIPNVAVESYEKLGKTNENLLKMQFSMLKQLGENFPKNDRRFGGNPIAIVYNRTMDRFAEQIKKIDPAYELSFSRADETERMDLSTLPIQPVVVPVGTISAPEVKIVGKRTSANVVEESYVITSDYFAPVPSIVTGKIKFVDGTESKPKTFLNMRMWSGGKEIILKEAISASAGASSSVSEAPPSEVLPTKLIQEKVSKPDDVELTELATLQAKMEITSEINCQNGDAKRACLYYQAYLKETIPSQLSLVCKTEECHTKYQALQKSLKDQLKAGLFPELESLAANGAFVDPFKATDTFKEAVRAQKAYDDVMKPVLLKYLPLVKLKALEGGASARLVASELCSKDQQAETGGSYQSCLASSEAMVKVVKAGESLRPTRIEQGPILLKAMSGVSDSIASQSARPSGSPKSSAEAKTSSASSVNVSSSMGSKAVGQESTRIAEKAELNPTKKKSVDPEAQLREAKEAAKLFD